MNAREAKSEALAALRFMARPGQSSDVSFGYAWGTLCRIAGITGCPLPGEIGPPKPEYAAAFEACR